MSAGQWQENTGTYPERGGLLARSAAFAEPFIETVALIGVVCHPVFYLIWTYVFPQPYESPWWRLAGSLVCLPLVFKNRWPEWAKPWLPAYWHFAVLFTIPFFFTLFMLLNDYAIVWVLTATGGTFLLTFFMHWRLAGVLFFIGTAAAFALHALLPASHTASAPPYEIFLVYLFVLGVGGAINDRLARQRDAEAELEHRLRALSGQNAAMLRERNRLLGHFLNNSVIARLSRFESEFGLDAALRRMIQQERRYCAMMQADIRNFTRMFDRDDELQVAQLVAQCFSEITSIGQDLSVIKPVGDCIFLYSDVEDEREDAVLNVFALACVFVQAVERINQTLVQAGAEPLNFGVAVHAGEVIYGNLASDTLIDPTIIGVHVNRTARLEELTKSPEVRRRVGINAIMLSEEFWWLLRKAGLTLPGLVTLELREIGVSVRDFPAVTRVFALPMAASLPLCTAARERIRAARVARSPGLRQTDYNRHREIEYCYEMYGSGPNVVWSIFVNVSAFPAERVQRILRAQFGHLKATLSSGRERWLALSTEGEPGAYDENDVESWVIDLIDRLASPAAGATGPEA